jgi:hypothetical protein
MGRHPVALVDKPQQEVPAIHVLMAEPLGLAACQFHDLAGAIGELRRHVRGQPWGRIKGAARRPMPAILSTTGAARQAGSGTRGGPPPVVPSPIDHFEPWLVAVRAASRRAGVRWKTARSTIARSFSSVLRKFSKLAGELVPHWRFVPSAASRKDALSSLLVLSKLDASHSQQVPGVGMIRRNCKNLPVDLLGNLQSPRLMVPNGNR